MFADPCSSVNHVNKLTFEYDFSAQCHPGTSNNVKDALFGIRRMLDALGFGGPVARTKLPIDMLPTHSESMDMLRSTKGSLPNFTEK